jgi:GTPase
MAEPLREELAVRAERVLLVGVLLPDTAADPRDPLGELRSLAKTANANVVDEMVAKRQSIHPGLYVGTGKARQIAQRCEMNDVDAVIFDNDLAPGQIRDLEKICDRKVLDRSELILDIFATHARTAQSRLQVELAQLEYTYPRLTGLWSHLDRHGGGVGTRGPGERQIETDRRLVQKRVSLLKDKLQAIDRRKLREVRGRSDAYCACLVGYTNAGKSTLMNRLTEAGTYVADKLFATLETRTRQWEAGLGQTVLLSDTVGFVRDLPHHLVASFRATLEEAIHADMLLHVVDASHPHVGQQIRAVDRVLDELGCDRSREQLVLNKTDQIIDPTIFAVLREKYPDAILVSAVNGRGIDELAETVARCARGKSVRVDLEANYRNGRLMQYIAQHAEVENETYNDAVACIRAVMPADRLEEIEQFGPDIRIVEQVSL